MNKIPPKDVKVLSYRGVGGRGANGYADTHEPIAGDLRVAALAALGAKHLHHPSVYILTMCGYVLGVGVS